MARRSQKPSLASLVTDFLADLEHANRSVHTSRAYATDLGQFVAFHTGHIDEITPEVLRAFEATRAHLSPATRARKQAALASFLAWAYRQDLIEANPMGKIDRVRREPAPPRGLSRDRVEAILARIPRSRHRDRLLFRMIFETGIRIGEALAVYLEDLDLTPDDEHMRVIGKGDKRRTVLLDDPALVRQLRSYLKAMGYSFGPLFRAEKNGRGGPLRYQSVQARWTRYCKAAGVDCTLHQLRHSHATELINAGVSLATIRKRLGHKNLQTTLLYAELSDATADKELRAWRRGIRRKK